MAQGLPGDLVARAHANFAETFWAVASVAPGGGVAERGGVQCMASGLPYGSFNRAFVLAPPHDAAAALSWAAERFREWNLPWSVVATPEAEGAIAKAAHVVGLARAGRVPGMLLTPLPAAGNGAPGLEIAPVRDARQADDFAQAAARSFDSPQEVFAAFCHPRVLETPGLALYVGYCEDRPVATAARYVSHGIAGLLNIGVLPRYRRRGFGEAMTAHAAAGGTPERCLAASLQATPMGRPLYARMGFRQVVEYVNWDAHPRA
ncbi:MAG: GNAT family N-acetyltransferase [Tepidiformaceae bacterium]